MKEQAIQAGFARVNVTATQPTPLGGYGNTSKRLHKNVLDGMFITALALRDEDGETVLLLSGDALHLKSNLVNTLAETLAPEGIRRTHIILSATHSHSETMIDNDDPELPYMNEYRALYARKLEEVCRRALADLRPCEVYSGTVQTCGMNFVRHYIQENGAVCGDGFGSPKASPIVGHTSEVDPSMHIIRFARGEFEDIIFVNWRGHATKTGGGKKYNLSADYPMAMRMRIEQKLLCHAVFFQGACGNVNTQSRIPAEKNTEDYLLFGSQLAQYVIDAVEGGVLEKRKTAGLRTVQVIHHARLNVPTEREIELSRKVQKVWVETNDRKLAVAAGDPAVIHSPYHANSVMLRSRLTGPYDLELNAVAMGEIAFLSAPNELFCGYVREVTEASPFATTAYLGLANDYRGYVPSAKAYDHGCYEADCTRCAKGTGEEIADCFTAMLKELKAQLDAEEAG